MNRSFINGLLRHGSLEVAVGAVVMSMAVASSLNVAVPTRVFVALFLAVWFIYILDRLFDAQKIAAPAVNPRHRFYQKHQSALSALLVLLGVGGLVLLPTLPVTVLVYGVVLMGGCLLYLLAVFFSARKLPKEVAVAVLYTAGVVLAPKAMAGAAGFIADALLFSVIASMAFINLVLFSRAEQKMDLQDGQSSAFTNFTSRQMSRLVKAAFAVALACLAAALFAGYALAPLLAVFGIMLSVLWILFARPQLFSGTATYRLVGDGIFLLPATLLF